MSANRPLRRPRSFFNPSSSAARRGRPMSFQTKRKLLQFESLEDRRLLATVVGSLTPNPIYEGGPFTSPPSPGSSNAVVSTSLSGGYSYATARS